MGLCAPVGENPKVEAELGEVAVPGMGMDSLQEWDLPDL